MRILYFADIRFPLERANGIQTMETCHALAARGHAVDLIVRPDTHTPARDPFQFYGLEPAPRLRIEQAPVTRADGRAGVSATSRLPPADPPEPAAPTSSSRAISGSRRCSSAFRAALRPPLVYESHGYAPDVAAALPGLVSDAAAPDARKLRRLARREARVWHGADGYVTITAALAADLTMRLRGRDRLAVVPDGVANPACSGRGVRRRGVRSRSSPTRGTCIPGRAWTCSSRRSRSCRTHAA